VPEFMKRSRAVRVRQLGEAPQRLFPVPLREGGERQDVRPASASFSAAGNGSASCSSTRRYFDCLLNNRVKSAIGEYLSTSSSILVAGVREGAAGDRRIEAGLW
jgi:hypothetical protein